MFQTRMAMLAILVALGGNAVAATFCVNSGAELRSALASAQNNGESDEILVASGIHEVDSGSAAFAYSTSQDFAVSILAATTPPAPFAPTSPASPSSTARTSVRCLP